MNLSHVKVHEYNQYLAWLGYLHQISTTIVILLSLWWMHITCQVICAFWQYMYFRNIMMIWRIYKTYIGIFVAQQRYQITHHWWDQWFYSETGSRLIIRSINAEVDCCKYIDLCFENITPLTKIYMNRCIDMFIDVLSNNLEKMKRL